MDFSKLLLLHSDVTNQTYTHGDEANPMHEETERRAYSFEVLSSHGGVTSAFFFRKFFLHWSFYITSPWSYDDNYVPLSSHQM